MIYKTGKKNLLLSSFNLSCEKNILTFFLSSTGKCLPVISSVSRWIRSRSW